MKFQAVFFDLDDTLLDMTTSRGEAWRFLLGKLSAAGVEQPGDDLRKVFERHAFEEWALEEKPEHYAGPEVIFTRVWRKTLEEVTLSGAPGWGQLAAWTLEAMESSWRLFGDVEKVLSELHDGAGYRLAVVTNGSNLFQHRKFDQMELNRWFDAIFVAEECLAAKPDPEIFLFACRHLGVDPHGTLMVGDNIRRDAEGAMAAGLKAVWLNRTARPTVESLKEGVGVLTTLLDLPAWMAVAEGRG